MALSKIEVKRGDTWLYQFIWYEEGTYDEETETGTPVDLTGCSARLHIRDDIDGDLILDVPAVVGSLTIDGPNGTVDVNVPAATMATLEGDAAYLGDLELTFPDGTVTSTRKFVLVVLSDITLPS